MGIGCAGATWRAQVKETKYSIRVDDGRAGGIAIDEDSLRPASQSVLVVECDMWKGVTMHQARLACDEEQRLRGTHGDDQVWGRLATLDYWVGVGVEGGSIINVKRAFAALFPPQ